jgi:hypothetical protein
VLSALSTKRRNFHDLKPCWCVTCAKARFEVGCLVQSRLVCPSAFRTSDTNHVTAGIPFPRCCERRSAPDSVTKAIKSRHARIDIVAYSTSCLTRFRKSKQSVAKKPSMQGRKMAVTI